MLILGKNGKENFGYGSYNFFFYMEWSILLLLLNQVILFFYRSNLNLCKEIILWYISQIKRWITIANTIYSVEITLKMHFYLK